MSIPDNIILDPEICGGKPTIKGTRVLVSVILDYIEEGQSFDEILKGFPSLTVNDIQAAVRYARIIVEGTHFDNYQQTPVSS